MTDSINKLVLDDKLLASLYPRSLVQIDALPVASVENTTAKRAVKFLGHNNKKIAVLVNYPDHSFLPESHLGFLSKLLEACKLNIGDVAIVNMAAEPASTDEVVSNLSSEKVISFGAIDSAQDFSTASINGVPVLNAPPLELMLKETPETRTLKSRLWSALKQMFDL